MRLNNLCFPGGQEAKDLWIGEGRIRTILPSGKERGQPATPALNFKDALVFPGLINSHDHLDFNLFPLLGNSIYKNYTEWGPDIHTQNAATIKAVLQVPQELRILWGIYKNLLNGFTTVVNHGERLVVDDSLINVFQDCHCLHSVGFERHWKWKLNRPGAGNLPWVLHVGEGTDGAATKEIDQLIRWNLFKRPLIGIHGVAMNERQATAFRGLIWCPASNYFLLDRTAPIDRLKGKVPLLFGTDSTLTSGWNGWAQIRMGRSLHLTTDQELLDMLTTAPAAAWGLKDRGVLAEGSIADLVIARPKSIGSQRLAASDVCLHSMDAFYGLDPEDILLVLHEGNIRLFDPGLLEPLTAMGLASGDFHQTRQDGKYVQGDLPGLMQEIRGYYPEMRFPAMP